MQSLSFAPSHKNDIYVFFIKRFLWRSFARLKVFMAPVGGRSGPALGLTRRLLRCV